MPEKNIFRTIWENAIFREFVLLVVATFAVQLFLGFNELADLIETSADPFTALTSWLFAFLNATFVLILKQLSVWGLQKMGKVPVSGRPGTRTPGDSPGEAVADAAGAVGIGDGGSKP